MKYVLSLTVHHQRHIYQEQGNMSTWSVKSQYKRPRTAQIRDGSQQRRHFHAAGRFNPLAFLGQFHNQTAGRPQKHNWGVSLSCPTFHFEFGLQCPMDFVENAGNVASRLKTVKGQVINNTSHAQHSHPTLQISFQHHCCWWSEPPNT